MARREVLVQLDDDLVQELDALAARLGTSRSELLRRGAAAVIDVGKEAEYDRLLVESYRKVPQDAAFVEAAAKLALRTWPDW